jgi:polysaccharide biosynthesis/export protein
VLFSCVSNEKIIYLQNPSGKVNLREGNLIKYDIPEYRLQYNDIVSIDIMTSVQFINQAFDFSSNNKVPGGAGQSVGSGGGDIYYMTGYSVDKHGQVELPLIGKVKVAGLTLEESKEIIKSKISNMVTEEVFVRVKLGGIRFSAFGEFHRPGKYTILAERITIFEALAHAGDLNYMAKRNEVLLIRQYPEGSILHRVNLQDREIINTPYYFIQNNDQLYVEPLKIREVGNTVNVAQTISIIGSVLTTGLLIFSVLNN